MDQRNVVHVTTSLLLSEEERLLHGGSHEQKVNYSVDTDTIQHSVSVGDGHQSGQL